MFIPARAIEEETNEAILNVLTYLISGLVLLSVLSLVVMNRNIIRPLTDLTGVSRKIAETGDLDQEFPTGGTGEIGVLSATFGEMIDRIKQDERDKDALIHEIYHRVKNNLSVVTGFISMQIESSDDPQVRSVLEDLENRVMGLDVAQTSIYQYESFANIDAKIHFYRVMTAALMKYHQKPDITVEVDSGDFKIDAPLAMNTSLLLTEIVILSLKYSMKNRDNGRISLRFQNKNGIYELTVSDDGAGLAGIPDMPDNIGMKIIERVVKMTLKGTYEVKNEGGMKWVIRFPG